MGVIEFTIKVRWEAVDVKDVPACGCGAPILFYNLLSKRNKHQGTTARCQNKCGFEMYKWNVQDILSTINKTRTNQPVNKSTN